MNNNLVLHAWTVHKSGDDYYLPYTHWVYLNEIVKFYKNIYLLSPVKESPIGSSENFINLGSFNNVFIKKLPYSNGYIAAIKYFFHYYKAYKKLKDIDVFYARYPIPFGWLAKIFYSDKKRIIHFVGDPIDVTISNPNLSKFKKKLMLWLFQPEHQLYLWACNGAEVYTNGFHLAERLNKKEGMDAKGLISSTLNKNDFFNDRSKFINPSKPKLLYLGYLRKAKGVEILIRAFEQVKLKYPGAEFSIIGSGEYETELRGLIQDKDIKDIRFLGHIDNREYLNKVLRSHDIFCFASLSEGSPRVVLEAMANGLAVVSTPVGSLPMSFKNENEILFANFNDHLDFGEKLIELISNPQLFEKVKNNGFKKVKSFTIETFIREIFYA